MTERIDSIVRKPLRYQNHYVWFVFMSALDIMFTWIVLFAGGWEANLIADRIIRTAGLPGLVAYKFAIVVFVIVLCEIVARHSDRAGRGLATLGVIITTIPVLFAIVQLLVGRLA